MQHNDLLQKMDIKKFTVKDTKPMQRKSNKTEAAGEKRHRKDYEQFRAKQFQYEITDDTFV